jgi:NAD(P)-dependent dehydrogenase (short-subunit alcohol dehydrogenase family)
MAQQPRTIVITGASDGIGARAAQTLAAHGHRVVVVGRSLEKTRAVAHAIDSEYHVADFAELSQVRALATTLSARHPHIDVLINNAGGIFREHQLTIDGHEKTLQVNHLAPYLLTNLLLDRLKTNRAAVIQTASTAALKLGSLSRLDTDDLDGRTRLSALDAYADAKLANILFTRELQRRHHDVAAVAYHPGNVATNFASDTTAWWRLLYNTPLRHLTLTTVTRGTAPLMWLAEGHPGHTWQAGSFYTKTKLTDLTKTLAEPEHIDRVASRLWERSAQLVS